MFSRRTAWNRQVNVLARRTEELRAQGRHLIDLTESNPTRVGLSPSSAELHELLSSAAREAAFAVYEPDPRGLRTAREALFREGLLEHADVDQVFLTASTSEAYGWLFKLLCDPGDDVLIPNPSYPLFEFLTGLEAVETRAYPLHFDGEWHLDAHDVAAASTERTRAVLVVNPGNPTGAFLKTPEHAALSALCAERGWALISDEVFAPYGSRPAPPSRVRTAARRDSTCLTFALSGLSKVAALPQLKLGWIQVAGPAGLRDEACARLELIADTYLSVNAPAQCALPALLPRIAAIQARVRGRTDTNRSELARQRPADAEWNLLPSEGGWSAILRIPSRASEEEVCLRLLEEGVVVQPGFFYDFAASCYLVLSLLPDEESFAEGARRLAAVLRSL